MSSGYLWFLSIIAARTLIVILFCFAALRFFGKREIGQFNIYDIAFVMALANAVQNAMTMGKGDITVGIVSAGSLLLLGRGFSIIFVKVPKLEDRIIGMPTVIVNHGRVSHVNMRREHVNDEELMQVIRQHGLTDVRHVRLAVLEVDGTITVVPIA